MRIVLVFLAACVTPGPADCPVAEPCPDAPACPDVAAPEVTLPRPRLQVAVNGRGYDGLSPISRASRLLVRIQPDADFLASHPQDARYVITGATLLAQRSLGAPTEVATLTAEGDRLDVPLGASLKQERPGTRVVVRIDGIERVNLSGEGVPVAFEPHELVIGFVVK